MDTKLDLLIHLRWMLAAAVWVLAGVTPSSVASWLARFTVEVGSRGMRLSVSANPRCQANQGSWLDCPSARTYSRFEWKRAYLFCAYDYRAQARR